MEDAIGNIEIHLRDMQEQFMKMQQTNTLRIIKLEYEVMVLKQMVFKNIAKNLDGEVSDVSSAHESYTHVALLSQFEQIRSSLNYLDEAEIKRHLGLGDQ